MPPKAKILRKNEKKSNFFFDVSSTSLKRKTARTKAAPMMTADSRKIILQLKKSTRKPARDGAMTGARADGKTVPSHSGAALLGGINRKNDHLRHGGQQTSAQSLQDSA